MFVEQTSAERQLRTAPARLAQLTQQSTLDMCIALNPSQVDNAVPPVLLSDTMKAVLGAVWIDCGRNVQIWDAIARSIGYVPLISLCDLSLISKQCN